MSLEQPCGNWGLANMRARDTYLRDGMPMPPSCLLLRRLVRYTHQLRSRSVRVSSSARNKVSPIKLVATVGAFLPSLPCFTLVAIVSWSQPRQQGELLQRSTDLADVPTFAWTSIGDGNPRLVTEGSSKSTRECIRGSIQTVVSGSERGRGEGRGRETSVVNKELGQWPRAKPGWRERRGKRKTKDFESQEPRGSREREE